MGRCSTTSSTPYAAAGSTTRRASARSPMRCAGDEEPLRAMGDGSDTLDAWTARWRARLAAESRDPVLVAAAMDHVNPIYIARNQLVERGARGRNSRRYCLPSASY